ncbi:MAG: polysaccharide deacetylase family protein [Treponema sp.]|nr:polysaccharide deacetylase family protein [Treponema sp.]
MKYLCLSFDDGPNLGDDSTMNEMLDILEKNGVPASFFLIGNKITEDNKKVIERALQMGCDIQNHSWSHPAMGGMTKEEIAEEYSKCDEVLEKIMGKKAEFFRPPYISVGPQMYDVIKVPFICGKGCNDWDNNFDAEYRYEKILEMAEDGLIFLLHVMEGNRYTLEAVEKAIPVLKGQGYEFVNLPTLFDRLNVDKNIELSLWNVVKNDSLGNRSSF